MMTRTQGRASDSGSRLRVRLRPNGLLLRHSTEIRGAAVVTRVADYEKFIGQPPVMAREAPLAVPVTVAPAPSGPGHSDSESESGGTLVAATVRMKAMLPSFI
jgi:hypothetical protein